MRIETTFYIDHYEIDSLDLRGLCSLLRGLGFTTGNPPEEYPDMRCTYFNFDRDFLECGSVSENREMDFFGRKITVGGKGGIHVLAISTRDPERSKQLMESAGFDASPISSAARAANHGVKRGDAGFSGFFSTVMSCFPKTYLGPVQLLNPELIFQDGRYAHPNRVTRTSALYYAYPTAQAAATAAATMAKITDTLGDTIVKGGIETAIILDGDAYEAEFGSPLPTEYGGDVAAVVYAGADKEFVRTRAEALGLSHFDKCGKLYVDLRPQAGTFFIFE